MTSWATDVDTTKNPVRHRGGKGILMTHAGNPNISRVVPVPDSMCALGWGRTGVHAGVHAGALPSGKPNCAANVCVMHEVGSLTLHTQSTTFPWCILYAWLLQVTPEFALQCQSPTRNVLNLHVSVRAWRVQVVIFILVYMHDGPTLCQSQWCYQQRSCTCHHSSAAPSAFTCA